MRPGAEARCATPEGDTIHRTAATLDRWIGGRTITAASGSASHPSLVGDTIVRVEAAGKHVLMRLASGRTLHSHMRMQGAWHVYPTGARWQRPRHEARLVLEAGDRVAVCFNAPVVSLSPWRGDIGPDVLADALDVSSITARVALQAPSSLLGDLLLDQRVASGIGNIWRCETLFLHGVHPRRRLDTVAPTTVEGLYVTASRLMRASVNGIRGQHWVYRRTGRPCRRCGRTIESAPVGTTARRAYWCPGCQPP